MNRDNPFFEEFAIFHKPLNSKCSGCHGWIHTDGIKLKYTKIAYSNYYEGPIFKFKFPCKHCGQFFHYSVLGKGLDDIFREESVVKLKKLLSMTGISSPTSSYYSVFETSGTSSSSNNPWLL